MDWELCDFSDGGLRGHSRFCRLLHLPPSVRKGLVAASGSEKRLNVALLKAERQLLKRKHVNRTNSLEHAKGYQSRLQRVGRGKHGGVLLRELNEWEDFSDYDWEYSVDFWQEEVDSLKPSAITRDSCNGPLQWSEVKRALQDAWPALFGEPEQVQMYLEQDCRGSPAFTRKIHGSSGTAWISSSRSNVVGSSVRANVCNAISGTVLCNIAVPMDAFVFDLKNAICRSIGMPPAFQVLFLDGDELRDDALQLFSGTAPESVTVSLLGRRGDQCDQVARQALQEMQSLGCRRLHIPEIVRISRANPVESWIVLAAINEDGRPSPSRIIAAMVARNGSEIGARNAIEIFMKDSSCGCWGVWCGKSIRSNRHAGGHGTYREWLRRFHGEDAVAWSICLLNRSGFEGLQTIMDAFEDTLKLAGHCQKALILFCAAGVLPRLSKMQAKVCANWFVELLHHESPELRVCAVICLQRIMSGNKVSHIVDLAMLLKDDDNAVRFATIVALGCCGCRAAPFAEMLAEQLDNSSPHIRYAALVTLGGLQAAARPHAYRVARLLSDSDSVCRLGALRALKCIGDVGLAHLNALQDLRQMPGSHAIARRALTFAEMPLRHVFRGPAPLGKRMELTLASASDRLDAHEKHVFCMSARTKLGQIRHKILKLEALATPCSKNRIRKLRKLKNCEMAWADAVKNL